MAKKKGRIGAAPQAAAQKARQQQEFKAALKKTQPFRLPNTDKKIVASLGWKSAVEGGLSTHFKPDAWHEIRIDQDPFTKPDLVSPLNRIEALEDHSVDGIWISHLLQRFVLRDVSILLREAMRILKDNGQILVSVPDMQLATTYLANGEVTHEMYRTNAGPITPIDMVYGFQKAVNTGDGSKLHRSGYTAQSLSEIMRAEGVCNMQVQRHAFDIVAFGLKLPYGHPERVERVVLYNPKEERPKAPAMPAVEISPTKTMRYADRLEDAPKRWKPLNLNKTGVNKT